MQEHVFETPINKEVRKELERFFKKNGEIQISLMQLSKIVKCSVDRIQTRLFALQSAGIIRRNHLGTGAYTYKWLGKGTKWKSYKKRCLKSRAAYKALLQVKPS